MSGKRIIFKGQYLQLEYSSRRELWHVNVGNETLFNEFDIMREWSSIDTAVAWCQQEYPGVAIKLELNPAKEAR